MPARLTNSSQDSYRDVLGSTPEKSTLSDEVSTLSEVEALWPKDNVAHHP